MPHFAWLPVIALLFLPVPSAAYPPAEPAQPVLGKKLQIKARPGDPESRSLRASASEQESPASLLGDPTADGATLEVIVNGGTPSLQTFALPAGGWTASSRGFKFSGSGLGTAVTRATIERSSAGRFQIKVALDGRHGAVDVMPPNPGSDGGLILTIPGAASYCVAFGQGAGGEVTADNDRKWSVRNPTAALCPAPVASFHRLSVTRFGSGTVTSAPAGIECGGDCTEDYEASTPVTLEAEPAGGFTFAGWSGDCTGTGSCHVTMDAARNVVATFDSISGGCITSEPSLVLAAGPAPGPAVMYDDAPDVAPLQNRHARFEAAPLLVSGHEAYRAGEYLYQDYVHDDFGAETSGVPFSTAVLGTGMTGTATPDAAFHHTGDLTYPNDVARYGNNAADLVELRIAPGPTDVAYRVTLNTLLAEDTTIVAIAWNSDGAATGTATLSRDPGVALPGTDEVIYLWGTGGEHVRYNGLGLVAATTPLAVTTDLEANQMTVFVPRSAHNPSGSSWKYVALAGVRDAAGAWVRPSLAANATTPGGAGPAAPLPCAVFDLSNHFAIPGGLAGRTGEICHFMNGPCDMVQALDLRGTLGAAPALGGYARSVDFDQLAAPGDSTTVPASGTLVRIFPSRLVTAPAEGRSNTAVSAPSNDSVYFYGPLQAYSIFLPSDYDAAEPTPLTWANHSLIQFHWQYNGTEYVQEIGEKRGNLVVTPNSRATDGFYVGRNEYDHFEVWSDVRRNYNVDASRSAMSGYSMGGYATYRLASLYPDLFGKAFSIVGPPGAGIWTGTGGASTGFESGDDWSTLTNYWLENVRNIPFFNMAMITDELVPITSTRQQNIGGVDPTGQAQSFDGLGYRYTFQEFSVGEHLTLYINDAYPAAKDFLGTAEVDPNPPHVTFSYVPDTDRPELTLVHDHAYWVAGLTLRDAAGTPTASGTKPAKGTIDAYSLAFGLADPVVSAQSVTPGVLMDGNVGPLAYTEYGRTWAGPAPIPSANTLRVTLTNLLSVQIDVERAALDTGATLVLETVSDGPATMDLFGAFDAATAIFEDGVQLCVSDGAMVGSVGARIPVAAGSHVYTLRVP